MSSTKIMKKPINDNSKISTMSDEEIIEIKKKELVEGWNKMRETNDYYIEMAKTRGGELKVKDEKINKATSEYLKLKTKCESLQKEIDELKKKTNNKKVCNMNGFKIYDINDIDLEKESNAYYEKIRDKEMEDFNKIFD